MGRLLRVVLALALGLLAFTGYGLPAAFAADADLQISKTVSSPGPYEPGDTFTYFIQVGCSSTGTAGCTNAVVDDTLPAPLILDPGATNPITVVMSPSATATVTPDGDNSFTVAGGQNVNGTPGIVAGGSMIITVQVKVPDDASADFDGTSIRNTAAVTAGNADRQTSSVDVDLQVPTTLVAGIDKTGAPGTLPATPDKNVNWTLTPSNESNQTVDTIVVEDTFDGTNQDYLDFDSITTTPAPPTTTSTTVEYLVGGSYTTTPPADPADVEGVRVTYEGTYAPGASGTVGITEVTNDSVDTIPTGDTVAVTNTAESTVAKGGAISTPDSDDASVNLSRNDPDVAITKTLSNTNLTVGQDVTAGIRATVGSQNVHELTINEPSAGSDSFTDQGLVFDGFGAGVAWPLNAQSASITYTGTGCPGTPQTTTTPNTLPDPPAGCTVDGFSVTYTAADGTDGIQAGSYADIPVEFTATTDTDVTLSSTNDVDTTVTNLDGADGTDNDSASFQIRPLEVHTETDKTITPDSIYAVPGATSQVALPSKVTDSPDSTIGSDHLIVSDPARPPLGTAFFTQYFNVTRIASTDIPACTTLTVNYWSTTTNSWTLLTGPIAGAVSGFTYAIPASVQSQMGGIQFDFEPSTAAGCPSTLPPGFNVIPRFDIQLKPGVDNVDTTLTNTDQSEVHNDSIDQGDTDDASDTIDLNHVDDGTGVDLVDKTWLQNDVPALSGGTRTARVTWTTGGLNFAQMVITDPASPAELGPGNPGIATSVYDAFNLARIAPITPATDPQIAGDRVSKVELYLSGAWTDVTSQACSSAAACTGTFPGLVLNPTQQQTTTGMRITFAEDPAGAGIGTSAAGRPLDLDFTLRDTLRSNPSQYVLGEFHPYTYNTGTPGVVDNTVNAVGSGGLSGTFTATDDDTITITDAPVDVDTTKTFDQDVLGLPDSSVDPTDYPLIDADLSAANASAAKVSSLSIADPSPDQADPTAFDVLDLVGIASITPPVGLSTDDLTVTLTRGLATQDYTYTQALGLAPSALADVTGVTITAESASGAPVIVSGGVLSADLVFRLRQTKRSGGPVTVTNGTQIVNDSQATADSPGRIPCPGTACSSGIDNATDGFNIVDASYSISTSKTINPTEMYEDVDPPNYTTTLHGQPDGNARTTLFTLTDDATTFWNVMDYASASLTVPAPINSVRMDVNVGGSWIDGAWTDATPGSNNTFALPSGVSATDVVGVRFQFRSLDATDTPVQWERPFNPSIDVALRTTRRDTQRSTGNPVTTDEPGMPDNTGESAPGVISNSVQAHGDGQFGDQTFTDDESDTASTLVKHLVNAISVSKSPGNPTTPPTYNPVGTVPYVLTFTNDGQWPMTGFTVTDQFDLVDGEVPVVEPDPTAYTFSLTSTNPDHPAPDPTPAFTASLDETTGLLTVTMPPGFVFYPGWTLTVNAPLKFAPGLSPDAVVHNTVTTTSDRDFENCDFTSDTASQPTTHNVEECSADTDVAPLAAAPLSMAKSVKGVAAGAPGSGDDDLGVMAVAGFTAANCTAAAADIRGFYKAPCLPVTRPGGIERWQLEMRNTGNANAKVIALVDTLPKPGDTGVITSAARGSEFATTLRNVFDSNLATLTYPGATLTAYYSTARLSTSCNNNAMRVHTANESPDPSCAFGWTAYTSATSDATLAAAQSIKFVIDWGAVTDPDPTVHPGLRPGETLRVTFDSRTATAVPKTTGFANPLPVAFNSFAGSSRVVATAHQNERAELSLEPTKAGIATAFGAVSITKDVSAPAFSVPVTLPGTYAFDLECLSDGDPVALVDASGAPVTSVSVTVSGTSGTTVVNTSAEPVNMPLFATCTFTENPVPTGATVDYDPGQDATADGSLASIATVHHPYAGDDDAQTAVTATNTYTAGGFTVTKTVTNGGAVDQDGDPIAYDQVFTFTASCTYLGTTILTQSFTLTDGQSKAYTGLPTGASCTVTETLPGLATPTITVDGAASTNPATFTIGNATTVAVAVTNAFTVGSVTVTKDVTGDGALPWGLNPFTVHMRCTLATADPDVVYEADHQFQAPLPANLTWTVDNLPTGAQCTVTEPQQGGANSTTIAPNPVTVGVAPAVTTVAITNTFTTGSVEVRKFLLGAGTDAPPISNGSYVMTISCTRVVDGATVPVVPIPGGADRTITGAGTATWDGLPGGARCRVSETSSTPEAQATFVLPAGGLVTVPNGGTAPTVVRVANYFGTGYLQITKLLTGPGAALPPFQPMTFQVTCTLEGETLLDESVTLTPEAGDTSISSDVLGPLTVGTTCLVEETDAGDADATNAPVTVVITSGTRTTPVVATITNTYGAGTVEITKVLGGKFADEDLLTTFKFPITVTCQLEYVDATGATVRGTVLAQDITIKAGKTKVITGADGKPALVPTGSHCWAEETDPMGASEVVITNSDYESGAVVPSTAGRASLDITVKNIYNDGSDLFPLTDDDLGGTGSSIPRPFLWVGVGAIVAGLVLALASRRRKG